MSELQHYGVKGMKWGVRRAEKRAAKKARDEPNSTYSSSQRSADQDTYGKRGVKRINRRMNAGKTRNQAQTAELGREVAIGLLATVVPYVALRGGVSLAVNSDRMKADYVRAQAAKRRGENAANQLLQTDYISSLPVTKLKRGSYKITDL